MSIRITDTSTNARLLAQVTLNRQRIAVAQEQVASGKRINRPSDDPAGAETVLRLRTTQAVIERFRSGAAEAKDRLQAADSSLDSYQTLLDRARALVTQGTSDSTAAAVRANIATQIDGLSRQMLGIANTQSAGEFVFGGTLQDAPPFDPTTSAPAATPAPAQQMQLEPEVAPVNIGVTAESVFSDASGTIFQELTTIAAALRGTGDAAADKATLLAGLDRLGDFEQLAQMGRVRIGVGLNTVDAADERLNQGSLTTTASASRIEGADFAAAALELTSAQTALEATLQTSAHVGRRTLIDFLG